MTDPKQWNDDRVMRLRELWLQGWTAVRIGEALGGFLKSAVLGKASRLGLAGRNLTREHVAARRVEAKLKSVRAATKPKAEPRPPVVKKVAPTSLELDPARFVTLLELTPHHCRYAVGLNDDGDQLFCGADNRGGRRDYCKLCADKMFVQPRKMKAGFINHLVRKGAA